MFDVVVLAGSSNPTALTEAKHVTNKALITIHGRIMLDYVLDALRQAKSVDRVAVVGPADELGSQLSDKDVMIVEQGSTIVENVQRGYSSLQPKHHFLVCSADVPFLTAEAVEDLLNACRPYQDDLYYPIVTRKDNELRFPGVQRTYVKLRDGEFTGGNLFVVNPACLPTALPRLEQIFALRKSPVRLASLLGIFFIFKLLTKRLGIKELEERFSSLFAVSAKAVISNYPEIGTDVDKLSDLALADRLLQPR